jgi:prepilin-type N-terminal cleavage/methylation domain-containing protein
MRRGFTLVEMVVVMAITGIVAAALMKWVDNVRTETRHGATASRWVGTASTAIAQIRRDARTAQAVTIDGALTLGETRWTAQNGTLRRGDQVMAREVKAARWQRAGRVLTVEIDFEAQNGTYTARRTHQGRILLPEGAP